jgi:hypothetical protein
VALRDFVRQYSDLNGHDLSTLEQSTLSTVHRDQLVSDTRGLRIDAILQKLGNEMPLQKSIKIRFEILEELNEAITSDTSDTSPALSDSQNQVAQLYDEVEQQHHRLKWDTAIYRVLVLLTGQRFNDVREELLDLLGDETDELLQLRQHQLDLLEHLQLRMRENHFAIKFYKQYGKAESKALREHEEIGKELVNVKEGVLGVLDGIIKDLQREDLASLRELFGVQLDKLRKVLQEDRDIAEAFASGDG